MQRRAVLLNLIFIAIFVISIILSLYIGVFFFIPIICFLPFTFRKSHRNQTEADQQSLYYDQSQQSQKLESPKSVWRCPTCGGEINESSAQFCYHCGSKL